MYFFIKITLHSYV